MPLSGGEPRAMALGRCVSEGIAEGSRLVARIEISGHDLSNVSVSSAHALHDVLAVVEHEQGPPGRGGRPRTSR